METGYTIGGESDRLAYVGVQAWPACPDRLACVVAGAEAWTVLAVAYALATISGSFLGLGKRGCHDPEFSLVMKNH